MQFISATPMGKEEKKKRKKGEGRKRKEGRKCRGRGGWSGLACNANSNPISVALIEIALRII